MVKLRIRGHKIIILYPPPFFFYYSAATPVVADRKNTDRRIIVTFSATEPVSEPVHETTVHMHTYILVYMYANLVT